MAANEGTSRIGSGLDTFFKIVLSLIGIVVLLGIGYVYWPQVKATYEQPLAQPATAPAADTTEIDAIKAQLKKTEAALRTIRAAQSSPDVIVQSVPAGEAPQPVTIPAPAPVAPAIDSEGTIIEPPAPPIIIVHQVSADGAHQTVTGSGACAVGGSVARRCGK